MALRAVHFAACILDPNCKGNILDEESYIAGSNLISNLAPKFDLPKDRVYKELMNYKAETGVWGSDHLKQSATLERPSIWWKGMCAFSGLSRIACGKLELPCTSASTERSFSTHVWIHSSKRNRLLAVRAGKITYISHNLKLLDKIENKKIDSSTLDDVSDNEEEITSDDIFHRRYDEDEDSPNESDERSPESALSDEFFPDASNVFETPDSNQEELQQFSINSENTGLEDDELNRLLQPNTTIYYINGENQTLPLPK